MTALLPIRNRLHPTSPQEAAEMVAAANEHSSRLYVVGGGSSAPLGLPADVEGDALHMDGCARVIDYPARDMTITVEAGATMANLNEALSAEGQELPLDVPFVEQATIGGVVAANWNGHRRYGRGAVRDYVIGVHAIDGRGVSFKAGGRVVKNVAGYDFCKLLTGSNGTLAVLTQLTLKVAPITASQKWLVADCADWDDAERLLAGQTHSAAAPVALELLAGPAWSDEPSFEPQEAVCHIAALFEGPESEVDWSLQAVQGEWRELGQASRTLDDQAAFRERLSGFAVQESPLVLKANIRPSGVVEFVRAARQFDEQLSVQAHAGNGVVHLVFPTFPKNGLHTALASVLRPAAAQFDGGVIVLANPSGAEMTLQTAWGHVPNEPLMQQLKRKFDPAGVLNPGCFVYSHQ